METKLYVFDEINGLDDAFISECTPYLSLERQEKAFSYTFPLDRNASIIAYLLLRLALMENYGINENVAFNYDKNGKPALRDYPHIHFNLSHCRTAAACALADREVGVDVEDIAPVPDEVARRVLTPKEYAKYSASIKTKTNPEELFCRYWTIKESWLKKTGSGIGTDLSILEAEDIGEKTIFKKADNYCCCVTGALVAVKYVNIDGIKNL